MRIVPPLQPGEELAASLFACREVMPIQHLGLQAGKERFHHCVVETIADSAHRTGDPELETAVREGNASVSFRLCAIVQPPCDSHKGAQLELGGLTRTIHWEGSDLPVRLWAIVDNQAEPDHLD
jgi:hypothetical protein